ncbi:MAG: uroporphyrinogen decarboxylase [Planctomycetales bacterium]|nr:uroporphyrinogen decarboxylase [Planctomycetales bacterium]
MTETSTSFAGMRVAAFESRRAEEMGRMIERFGGQSHVSPSLREVPAASGRAAIDFANRLMTGQIDVVIWMTGVGVRHLFAQIERQVDHQRFLAALADSVSVARGPKPVAALREIGVQPTYLAGEPNTWREVLTTIDAHVPLANLVVAVQEYGESSPSLLAGLEARGAVVERVRVYDWDFPEDVAPLEANVRAIASGQRDVAMFTSARQVIHLLKLAEGLDLGLALRSELERMVIASIGPTTTEALREQGVSVDIEPKHGKMGQLVKEAAERAAEISQRKKKVSILTNSHDTSAPLSDTPAPAWFDSPFMRACRLEPVPYTPIWLMRQAGRYMAEYREVRAQTTFLDLCKNPKLCSEVMCTAVDRLGVDAAIIFSDLLPILEPMGLDLEFAAGEGPVIHNPVREAADVDRLLELESVEALDFVIETVRQTRADLPAHLPLIGFSGAPFTLASYAIEGGASRNYLHTKTIMYRDAAAWEAIMSRLSRAVVRYLNAQIAAGAQVVQLFDSWVGCLGPDDYRRFVLPYMKTILNGITPGAPVIHFATGNPALLPLLVEAGESIIGVDWRVRLDTAIEAVGPRRCVQGNLDPMVLLADIPTIRQRAQEVLDQAAGRAGHIFNLGHGVLQQTPVENAVALVEAVHELSAR